jgi:hypothetical protein
MRLRVLSCDEVPTELASSGLQFTWIGDVDRGAPHDIITGSGGTNFPGMAGGDVSAVQGDLLLESLSDLEIPDGRTDDYSRAVEDGRMVLGYPGGADSTATKQLFSSAGATLVEVF